MANSIVRLPLGYFPDPDRGRPLFNAKIWVGEPDTLPANIPSNQKLVTGRQEDGTEVALGQPVRTSAGGIPVDADGNYVTLLVDGAYSMRVDDKNDNQVYYFANVVNGAPLTVADMPAVFKEFSPDYSFIPFNTVEDAKAGLLKNGETIDLAVGDYVKTSGYYSPNDGGGAEYIVVSNGTGVDDGGSYHDMVNGNQLELRVENGSVSPLVFGVLPDTVGQSVKMQKMFDFCSSSSVDADINENYDCSDAVLSAGSNFFVRGTGSFTDSAIEYTGTLGSEIGLSSDSLKGQNIINAAGASFNIGDLIFIKSVINCLSVDAGDDQLGSITGNTSYFAEFCRVIGTTGSTITVEENLIFDYTTTAGPNSGSRTNSTIALVAPILNAGMDGIKFIGRKSGEIQNIKTSYCEGLRFKNMVFEGDDESGNCINMFRSLNCVGDELISKRNKYPSASSLYNHFLTLGSQRCGFRNIVAEGGYQCVDFTFDVSVNNANPSVDCFISNGTFSTCLDGVTSHPGVFRCQFDDIQCMDTDQGIRLRSKFDRVTGFSVTKTTKSGFGVFFEGGYHEGAIVTGGTISGCLFGIQTQLYDTSSTPSPVKGRAQVSNIVTIDCTDGISFNDQTANADSSGFELNNITCIRCDSNGIEIGRYNNNITLRNITCIGPFGGSARAGIEYDLNLTGLTIDGVRCVDLGDVFGVRGPSSSSMITDLTTFPGGESEAQLSIRNLEFTGQTAGNETTGIIRDNAAFKDCTDLGVKAIVGISEVKQVSTTTDDICQWKNAADSQVMGISTLGELSGSLATTVKTDIAAAADLSALKTALDQLFK